MPTRADLLDQDRDAGTHETSVVSLASGRLQSAAFTVTLPTLTIVDPTQQWTLEIYESRDGGQAWTLACRTVDAGRLGRTTQPFLTLHDESLGPSHQFKARLILARTERCSGSLDLT